MSNTTNLDLEEILLSDNIKTTFLSKLNNNNQKIDNAYGILKDNLLNNTGKETLSEAIEEVNNSYVTIREQGTEIANLNSELTNLKSIGDASSNDIINGKVALVQGETITGTGFSEITTATTDDIVSGKTAYDNQGNLITGAINKLPDINVTLTGNTTYMGYISGYWAGINQNGDLIISAMSSSTAYESIYFVATSIGIGTAGSGFGISSHDTSNSASTPHACIVTGIDTSLYTSIDITLNASAVNSSYDYVQLNVTITGS